MIVTIDGPAGAGKSAARELARRMGYRFLDTGAMYRAVTLAGLRRELDWNDADALVALARQISIQLTDDRVLLDGEDVTREIRALPITTLSRYAADHPGVRQLLVEQQREAAAGSDVVTEGRDQGTIVFPEAECKLFLTASAEERAQRRFQDLVGQGESITFAEVLAKQRKRDERDRSRLVGPLVKAPDAIEIATDGMTPEQVVDAMETLVRKRV